MLRLLPLVIAVLPLLVLLALPLQAGEDESTPAPKPKAKAAAAKGCGCDAGLETAFHKLAKKPLTADETKHILHMRQEEKLARDVYQTLGKRWKLRPFQNIGAAERRHIEHLQMLMTHYEIKDPIQDDTVGSFADPAFTKLYTRLVAQGEKSEVEALKAGMEIEDLDIADLRALLALKDLNEHVALVAQNLLKGSRNHMRAFARNLASRGAGYKPQHLTQEVVDGILSAEHERGILYDQDGKPLGATTTDKPAGKSAGKGCGCKGQGKGAGKGQGKGAGKDCGCKGQGKGMGKGRGKGAGKGKGMGKGRGKGCGCEGN